MADDLNTPVLISHLFEAVKLIGNIETGSEKIDEKGKTELKALFQNFVVEIMGLIPEIDSADADKPDRLKAVVDLLLEIRLQSKNNKDWATSDLIRDKLKEIGIIVRDKKDGFDWELE